MAEEDVINFVSITSADPQKAAQYLRLTDNNLEQAIQLYFDSPNLDVGDTPASHPPAGNAASNDRNPIEIPSDDEMSDFDAGGQFQSDTPPAHGASLERDEEMARRLQEEMYGNTGAEAETGVRAPITRTTETLVGPGSNWEPSNDEDLDAMIQEQLAARRRPAGRPGIFNQQRTAQASVWDNAGDSSARRRELATATGGASDSSNKANMLAQMYRPPFELMFQRSWDSARDEGKEQEKWLLVNIQDQAIFDCQILNRDIWKNEDIQATVKENFIFMQYQKDDPRGQQYLNYYFQNRDSQDAYPHIAVVDPRTGEQVKTWSGPPVPKAIDFHAELHEFLDRYSLKANAKNPVATRKPERKKVDPSRMTEEEMLEMALQNSLDNNNTGPKEDDPDALTKDSSSADKGKGKATDEATSTDEPETSGSADSSFAKISESNPHTEPPPDKDTTTRIQFRSPAGTKVRRFRLDDPVRTLFEWIKSGGWEGKEGVDFELVFLRQNLIEILDSTIQEAGLKNGSVMVEFAE
jgi:hypothetical protein